MEDEQTIPDEQQDNDYIAAITQLRDNTVPKEKYAQLKEENSRLLKSLINGDTIEHTQAPTEPDVAQLRQELFAGEAQLTDLEYVSKVLALRDAIIENGDPDPFLPFGHHIAPTAEDREAAERVARVLGDCVEQADGDSAFFTSLVTREIIDVKDPHSSKRR